MTRRQRSSESLKKNRDKALSSQSSLLSLGIDVGTSGMRAVGVNVDNTVEFEHTVSFLKSEDHTSFREQTPSDWIQSLETLLTQCRPWLNRVDRLIVDGTSSTVLLINDQGEPLSPALMYDDSRAVKEAERIKELAPPDTAAHGSSSTLSKVLWLQNHLAYWNSPEKTDSLASVQICHQADFINHYLTGVHGITDSNNALKLGYDVINKMWPTWVKSLVMFSLPKVRQPGSFLSAIAPHIAETYQFNPECKVYSGTTDSIAAFFASGAGLPGDAVTSMGSTLALKILVKTPVFEPESGIYSHRVGHAWLAGGASNTGGASLLHFFELSTLKALLTQLKAEKQCLGKHWSQRLNDIQPIYPLVGEGERFPVCDREMRVNFQERPEKDVDFLIALIKGLVKVEKTGYERLLSLGGTDINRIYAVGGGAKNWLWQELRQSEIPGIHTLPQHDQAAFGVTRLLPDA